jgi:cytochrome c biogenesis protein ResB
VEANEDQMFWKSTQNREEIGAKYESIYYSNVLILVLSNLSLCVYTKEIRHDMTIFRVGNHVHSPKHRQFFMRDTSTSQAAEKPLTLRCSGPTR